MLSVQRLGLVFADGKNKIGRKSRQFYFKGFARLNIVYVGAVYNYKLKMVNVYQLII